MANQGKRMVQEDELKYLQTLKKEHEDPTAPWGGGGSDYTAGEGIDITENVISIDDETVALKTDIITSYNDLTDKPTIPTKTSDLNNDSGFITSSDIPTNYVTTDTTQEITSEKTFTGSGKKVKFKAASASDKLGISGYTSSNKEIGYLEISPNEISNLGAGTSNYLGYYNNTEPAASENMPHLGFKWRRKHSDSTTSAYALDVPPLYNAESSANWKLVYIPISVNGQEADNTGAITIPVPTKTSDLNNDSGFITASDIPAQVQANWNESDTSSKAYIQNKPTIPNAVSGTNDGTNWTTLTIGSDTYGVGGGGGSSYTFTNGLTDNNGTVSFDYNRMFGTVASNSNGKIGSDYYGLVLGDSQGCIDCGQHSGSTNISGTYTIYAAGNHGSTAGGLKILNPSYNNPLISDYLTFIIPYVRATDSSKVGLGHPDTPFKTLFVNNISDGTNSVTVADLAALITYAKGQG